MAPAYRPRSKTDLSKAAIHIEFGTPLPQCNRRREALTSNGLQRPSAVETTLGFTIVSGDVRQAASQWDSR
jgi:hypothetical protein